MDSTGFLFSAQVAMGQQVVGTLSCLFATPGDDFLTAFTAARPEISAPVSVPEGRSPRVYAVFMPGDFSAYKSVSVDDACACRRSLFGRFEADPKVTKVVCRGDNPSLFAPTDALFAGNIKKVSEHSLIFAVPASCSWLVFSQSCQASNPQHQQAVSQWTTWRRRRLAMLNPSLQAGVAVVPQDQSPGRGRHSFFVFEPQGWR